MVQKRFVASLFFNLFKAQALDVMKRKREMHERVIDATQNQKKQQNQHPISSVEQVIEHLNRMNMYACSLIHMMLTFSTL
jgi:hypothetical protein